jgi:uncharacterized protein YbjT (DUF2867 family)
MSVILVTGATGYIGGRLVPALVARGDEVRVLAREPRKLERRPWAKRVTAFKVDLRDGEGLDEALAGVEVAYYLVHSMTTAGSAFSGEDRRAAERFAAACARAGVRRIIYLGGLGTEGPGLSEHLRSRHETGRVLRAAGVPVTELRAAIIVGSGSASFRIIRDLCHRLPFMLCPRWVNSRCEPIAIRQVLAYLIGVLDEPRTMDGCFDIGGGEILTYAEMMRQCGEIMGRKIRILTVPVLTPTLSSYWLNLVTEVPFGLARPLVEGLKTDVVCTDHRIREWIRVPELSYREAVRLALARERGGSFETTWTDASTASAEEPGDDAFRFVDERTLDTTVSPRPLFNAIERVGGVHGWYHADWLWRVRAWMDWMVGGVGMRRARPDPSNLAVGDPVDFWRVEDIDEPHRLVLRAEMRLPGTARLSFFVEPRVEGSRLTLRAEFWPNGLFGYLYWYAVCPLHAYVFQGMMRKVTEQARREPATDTPSDGSVPVHGG